MVPSKVTDNGERISIIFDNLKIIQDETPMPLEEEVKLLEKTVIQKDLSTSLSTENEDKELKKAAPPTVRQEQAEVRLESSGLSVVVMSLEK